MLSCLRRGSKHLVRSKPVKASGAPRRTGRGRRARCDLGPKSGLMTRDRDSIGLRRHRWPREALRAAILARPHHPDQNAGQGSLMAPMMLAAAPPGGRTESKQPYGTTLMLVRSRSSQRECSTRRIDPGRSRAAVELAAYRRKVRLCEDEGEGLRWRLSMPFSSARCGGATGAVASGMNHETDPLASGHPSCFHCASGMMSGFPPGAWLQGSTAHTAPLAASEMTAVVCG